MPDVHKTMNATDERPESGAADAPRNYEDAVAELETLVARMEGGALSLEDSLAAYRRGATLVAYCQAQLEQVEQQVRVLEADATVALDPARLRAAGGDDV